MSRPALDTVLFDLDGTLIDSVRLIVESFRHTLEVHCNFEPCDETCLTGLGTTLEMQFGIYTDDRAELEAMMQTYRGFNLRHHDDLLGEYPEIGSALGTLRARGLRLGVVTSKPRAPAIRGLERCGIDGFFDVVVAADDVSRHKPDPAPVLAAMDALGARAAATAFVGDSPYDMEAGRRAAVRTAAAMWGPFQRRHLEPHQPDHWLDHPRDIGSLE